MQARTRRLWSRRPSRQVLSPGQRGSVRPGALSGEADERRIGAAGEDDEAKDDEEGEELGEAESPLEDDLCVLKVTSTCQTIKAHAPRSRAR